MRTLLQLLILLALPLGVSHAQSDIQPVTNRYEWSAQTVTAGGRVRVVITRQKSKLHLAKKSRPVILSQLNNDESDYYDELPDIQVGYRRPELINQTAEVHDDISDEIKIRLLLARKRALEAYHANWS
jgi:hypothetical protein